MLTNPAIDNARGPQSGWLRGNNQPAGHLFKMLSCGADAFGAHHEYRSDLQALFMSDRAPPRTSTMSPKMISGVFIMSLHLARIH